MSEKSCSGCTHEAFDPSWGGIGRPSGEMACCNCIRHPEQEKFYKMLKAWYKWWDIRARIFIWRNFRPSKCKDMYALRESLRE